MITNYSALIIDDEIENIQLLEIYIKKYCKEINEIHFCTTIEEGVDKYLEFHPNILFLDIHLGELSTSFTLLENCRTDESEIIFISSYEEYALKAISFNVTAYLIKPLLSNQLVAAVQKAIRNLELKSSYNQNLHQIAISNPKNSSLIAVASIEKIEFIHTDDIVYLEADGRYTLFYLRSGKAVVSCKNIGEYEKNLDQNIFFRVHYKYILNLYRVVNINKAAGNYCEMVTGKLIPIAKRRQELLFKFLNLK